MNGTIDRELKHYFEASSIGIELEQDGLQELSFGEFLIEKSAITRAQLFQALQLQDRNPGVRLGECLAALGHLPYPVVENYIADWNQIETLEATG